MHRKGIQAVWTDGKRGEYFIPDVDFKGCRAQRFRLILPPDLDGTIYEAGGTDGCKGEEQKLLAHNPPAVWKSVHGFLPSG